MYDISTDEMTPARHVLHDLGFFGHYLHMHAGGRSGQQHILVSLHKSGGHMTQRDLQELSGISSASTSEVLAKLEGAGLIERTRSDEDRRQLEITLTDEGVAQAESYLKERHAFESQCIECLSVDERERLITLLDRLVDHWMSLEGKEGCA